MFLVHLFLFCDTGGGTQGLVHSGQVLAYLSDNKPHRCLITMALGCLSSGLPRSLVSFSDIVRKCGFGVVVSLSSAPVRILSRSLLSCALYNGTNQ